MGLELVMFIFALMLGLVSVSTWVVERKPSWADALRPLQAARLPVALLSLGTMVGGLMTLFFAAAFSFGKGGFSGFVWILSLLEALLLLLVAGLLVISCLRSQGTTTPVAQPVLPQAQMAFLQPLLGTIAAGFGFLVLLLCLINLVLR